MRTKTPVLNWYAKDPELIRGLQNLFSGKRKQQNFSTLRLGAKWARKLRPGDRVAISVSDNPRRPCIIGYAYVKGTSLETLTNLTRTQLKSNLGAKTIEGVWLAMESVYPQHVPIRSTISILDLTVDN